MNRGVEIDGRGHCPNGDSVPKPLGFYAFRPGFQIRGAGVAGTLESRRPGRRSGCVPAEPCPPPGRTYINSSNNGIIDSLLPLDVSTMCPAQSVHHGPVHSLSAWHNRTPELDQLSLLFTLPLICGEHIGVNADCLIRLTWFAWHSTPIAPKELLRGARANESR